MTTVQSHHIEDRIATEKELDAKLRLVHEQIEAAASKYRQRVEREVVTQVAAALRSAVGAHAGLLKDANAPDGAGDRIRAYRIGLHADVLAPLVGRLDEIDAGAALASAHAGLLDELSSVPNTVDEEMVCTEPDALYMPAASDGLLRRFRKKQVRAARKLNDARIKAGDALRRVARRPVREIEPRRRRVPLRRLADYHALVRVPLEVKREHEALCGFVGAAMADVGRYVTDHVHAVLKTEEPAALSDADGLLAEAPRFDAALRSAADRVAAYDESHNVADRHKMLREGFERDVFESGSIMLDLEKRDVGRAKAIRSYATERDDRWIAWHRRVRSRLALMDRLLELRESTLRLQSTMTTRVLDECVHPVRQALANGETALDTLAAEAKKTFERGVVADDVRGYLKVALDAVETAVVAPLRDGRYGRRMRSICDDAAASLSQAVQDLPEVVAVSELDDPDPEHSPKEVELREQAARAYDALLIERLRKEAEDLARALTAAREEAESIPGILRFNLGTALEDVESDASARAEARELVVDGLARSAGVLRAAAKSIDERSRPFEVRIREVFETGFTSFHSRLQVEDRRREQMLDLRSDAEAGFRRAVSKAYAVARRANVTARRSYGVGLKRATDWIRIGRQAAGLASTTEEERFATLDVLIDTERFLENLPLVYRRLFSFDPVRDPDLLEGREREIRAVRMHLERWRRGLTNTLVVTAPHGSGHTSFLNVLQRTVFEDAAVHTLDLDRRLRTEDEIVEALCRALEIDDARGSTFDALADRLFTREESPQLPVCFIEHLEHVFLRQVGGTDLAKRFLTFLSRTDSRIMWIVTVSDYGWQVIRNAEPAAARLAVVQTLFPVTRAGLESIILNRHRRSGLPLLFEAPPTDANPLLARRLRRSRSDAERQDVLRTEYFDRLSRACEHHVMPALLYWLRSTEMDASEGLIRVRFVDPLNFAFLQTLGLDQTFTLKALLEHASLTVEEHSELFHLPVAGSLEHFEALGNLLLIEPLEKGRVRSRFAFSTVEEGVRYRIRPILTHMIIQFLRSRNVLH